MESINRFLSKITVQHIWALTVMVGIFAFVNTHPIRPHDFWWHLAIGRDILSTHSIPQVDTYSYTRFGQPYPSYNMFWLMEVLLFVVYRAGGPILIILMQSFLITTAYFVILLIDYRLSHSWRTAAFGVLFAAAMGFGNWNVRPQSVTYLLGALVFLSITEFRRTKKWLWLAILPVVMILWVNSHGSFPIGLALIGCWLAEEVWIISIAGVKNRTWNLKRLIPCAATLMIVGLACLVNPRGCGIFDYLGRMASNPTVQNNTIEWMPTTLNSLDGVLFFIGLMLLAVLLAVSSKRPSIFVVVSFLMFGFLGIKYTRGIVWFGLILAPAVSVHLKTLFSELGWGRNSTEPVASVRRLNLIFFVMLTLIAFFSLPWFKHLYPFLPAKRGIISVETPIKATQYLLNNHLSPQVFHDMAFGSYLIWAAQPEYKVFVDSRIELYPEEIWDDYWEISTAQSVWQDLLDKYRVNTLMLEPVKQVSLIEKAKTSPNWILVYEDSSAVIFERR